MLDAVVLGAGGFLGGAVARRLIDDGASVRVVGRASPEDPDLQEVWKRAADIRIASLDGDATATTQLIRGCKAVFNFAADMGGVGYLSSEQFNVFSANTRISLGLFEALERAGSERCFLSSSACAYPIELQQGLSAPLLRESQLHEGTPDKLYGREKRTLLELAEHVDADIRIGVIHTVYGIGQRMLGPRTKFPPAIVMKALQARLTGKIEIWGDGRQLRSFLWIDDAVEKVLRVSDLDYAGPTNIGFQGALSVDDVVALCCDHLGISPELVHLPAQPTGPRSRDCDNSAFTSRYGAMSLVAPAQGFARMIDWVDQRGHVLRR